jgi:uncharacterized protein YfdQ (DUF2303 family)
MELTHEAIQSLQTLIQRTVQPTTLDTHTPALLIAGSDGVTIENIEHLQEGRARYRGNYSTSSIADLTSYSASRLHTPVVFIDAQNGKAEAFFNLGDEHNPGHGDDRAHLTLQPTSAYRALLALDGKQFNQRQLAEWLEDWSDCAQPFYGDEVRPNLGVAIQAVRSIEIKAGSTKTHEDSDFGASRTAIEQIEARAKQEALQLPSGFIFTAQPFDCFEPVAFRLRLSVTMTDPPKLVLRVVAMADAQERIATEFVSLVRDGLTIAGCASAKIYRGNFRP